MFTETTSALMTSIRNFTDINLETYEHVLNASRPAIVDSTNRVVSVFGYVVCVFVVGCVVCVFGLGPICVVVLGILKVVIGILKVPCGIVRVLYREIKRSAAGSSRKPGDTRDQPSRKSKILSGQIKNEDTNVSDPRIPCVIDF